MNPFKSYYSVACTALLCYDFFLCLHSELPLIWAQRPSKVTLFYYLARYAMLAYLIVGWIPTLSNKACLRWCTTIVYGQHVLDILFSPIVAIGAFVKVFPTCGGKWLWTLAVVALNMVPLGTSIYVYTMSTPKIVSAPNFENSLECVAINSLSDQYITKVLAISRSCAIMSDLLVVATIMFYTRGCWSLFEVLDKRMPTLCVLIQRDGFVMFLFFALLDLADLIARLTTSKGSIFTTFVNPAISIVFSRITLKLMEATSTTMPGNLDEQVTHTILFVPHDSAGSSEPVGSEQERSIVLTVMSAVIPETGEEGEEVDVEEPDSQGVPQRLRDAVPI